MTKRRKDHSEAPVSLSKDRSTKEVTSVVDSTKNSKRIAWGTPFMDVPASRLDMFDEDSDLRKSQFYGVANFVFLCGSFYTFVIPGIRSYKGESPIDLSLAITMFEDVILLLSTWMIFILFSFSAYFWHLLLRYGIPLPICRSLEYICELIIVVSPNWLVWNRGWGIVPSTYILLCACVYFMKMHSYFETNRYYLEMEGSEGADAVYPKNLSFKNFLHFIICPSLVYESEFPKSKKGFRLGYLALKLMQFVFLTGQLYTLSTQVIIPAVIESYDSSLLETCLKLTIPLCFCDIIMFALLFECICNLFAEITQFGDRQFYDDWWNSTTFDEYSRKWNRPVHEFLLRHVYLKSRKELKISKEMASIITFVFSAILHEMIMMTAFRMFAPYLFAFMMLQIPFIFVFGRYFKGTKYGNYVFWICVILGMPIISSLYSKTWMYRLNQGDSEKMFNLSLF